MCVYVSTRYDDYDYGEVNQLLESDMQLYIKAVACFPDDTKAPVCPLPWAPLKPSERVRERPGQQSHTRSSRGGIYNINADDGAK